MVLSNGSNRSRYISSLINRNSGGGSRKAGFPSQIGRSSSTSIALRSTDPAHGRCCTLKSMMPTMMPHVNVSRNIGRNNNSPYWVIPGAH
jgi:hypothetical protein